MNNKFKPASRLTIVFILAVVISGSILTWFSINSISNLKELTENRILEEQRELSARFAVSMQNLIENVTAGFNEEISSPGLLKDSLIKTANAYDFITLPFIVENNGTFLFPNYMGTSENLVDAKFSTRFKTAFQKGENAEFAIQNLKTAKKQYSACLKYSKWSNDSVKALNALGRVSVKQNEPENAIAYYNLIITKHFNEIGSDGIPYVYYAISQLLKISKPNNCDGVLPFIELCLEKLEMAYVPLKSITEGTLTLVAEWLQKNTFQSQEKISNIKKSIGRISLQLKFIEDYRYKISEFTNGENQENQLNVGNDFMVVTSFSGESQELLLINAKFKNYPGFLIDGKKLFSSILNTNFQSGFEFEYNIEFQTGYNSNTNGENLIYSAQLNPYFPGQMILIQLRDESLINDFIQRRSWIYGIAAALLMLALFLGVVLILRDIAREKHLARLQSDFISNVTHELKTPLTSIYMFVESLLLDRVKSTADKKEYLSIILKESERLKRMINNILEFSKMEKGKAKYRMVNANLSSIIKTAVHEMEYWFENEKFELVTELDESIFAAVDPEKMKQVISNLLSNAFKYSNRTKKIGIRLYALSANINIEVEDKGLGIAEDKISRIFEKFYRIDQKESISGTGLGLTVVKEIVEAHNGRIEVSSKIGEGSKFSIILNQQKTEA